MPGELSPWAVCGGVLEGPGTSYNPSWAPPGMDGLGAKTLDTETFVVSVTVPVPQRLKFLVLQDFIIKSWSLSRFHETESQSLNLTKPKVKVLISFLRPAKLFVSPITAFKTTCLRLTQYNNRHFQTVSDHICDSVIL